MMTAPHPVQRLTPELIRATLRQIQAQRSSDSSPIDQQTLHLYQRLMETYSIVCVGGVEAQVEATQQSQQRQIQILQAEADPNCPQLLQQELADLERATRWRIEQLRQISPIDEDAVRVCLPDIEAFIAELTSSKA